MRWWLSHRFDPRAVRLADRHYSRGKVGSPQFVAPSSNLVLLTSAADAVWVTIRQEYVKHAYPGAWVCSHFRNESSHLSSELIREACAASRAYFGDPPAAGLVTFVDASKVRRKRDPGRCFLRAGFVRIGRTSDRDLVVLRLDAAAFPSAEHAFGSQFGFEERGEDDGI